MTFLVTLVLAGILGPEAYGVVALATVFILFTQMLLQSMISAVVQRKQLDPVDADTAFWLTLGASVFFAGCSVAASGWWAALYDLPQLGPVVTALSALVVVKGLVVVQEALLRRELDFRPLAIRTNVSVAAGGVAGIGLALAGAEVWALVGQQLVTGVVEVLVLWGIASWRPRLRFRRDSARDLLRFSMASSAGSVGVFVTNRSDALLLGLFFGPAVVGLYRLAGRVVESVSNFLMVSLQSVALPELARFQDQPDRFAERLLVIIRTSAIVGLPALGVVAGISEPFMAVLGDDWLPAGPALQVLCIYGAVKMTTGVAGPMLQAIGRPQYQAALAWIAAIFSTVTFVISGRLLESATVATQILGISISRAVLSGVVFMAVSFTLFVRFGHLPLRRLLSVILPSAGAGLIGAIVGGFLGPMLLTTSLSSYAALGLTAVVTGVVTLAILLAVEPHSRLLFGALLDTLRRRGGDRAARAFEEEPVTAGVAEG